MRKLYLVPIIHTSPDMGSLATTLAERATAELGHELWQKHQQVVSSFWDAIAQFFSSLDVNGFKIYQDGLVADGVAGFRIISEGLSRGSRNYAIISRLLKRGAIVVRTEDIALLRQEHAYITRIAHAKSRREKQTTALRYKLARGRLLKQRDAFIAQRIKETLGDRETGILFLGAYHNILPKLPDDIQVIPVKDVAKVREYHQTLVTTRKFSPRLQQLALYLTSPV